jgi:putative protease
MIIEGRTTGVVETVTDEIRVDGRRVERAVKGDRVSFAVPAKVRRNDKVFINLPLDL